MAIKYYPEDLNDNTIGLKFPLNGSTAGSNGGFFNTSRTTEDQAVTNYTNLLLTRKGERFMQPDFGVGLQLFLFEQNTPAIRSEIEFEINNQSAYWLPHITNHKIEVLEKADIIGSSNDPETGIQIVITFSVSEALANRTITIFEENGRIATIVE